MDRIIANALARKVNPLADRARRGEGGNESHSSCDKEQ
jgi:hypothetical protein